MERITYKQFEQIKNGTADFLDEIKISPFKIEFTDGYCFAKLETEDDFYQFKESVCLCITDAVRAYFYNGCFSILSCTCGCPECNGFYEQEVFTYGDFFYLYIELDECEENTGIVLKFKTKEFREEVKKIILLLNDFLNSHPTINSDDSKDEHYDDSNLPDKGEIKKIMKLFNNPVKELNKRFEKAQDELFKIAIEYGDNGNNLSYMIGNHLNCDFRNEVYRFKIMDKPFYSNSFENQKLIYRKDEDAKL